MTKAAVETAQGLALALIPIFLAAPVWAQDRYEPVAGAVVRQQPYQRFTTRDKYDRLITFYVSEEPDASLTLPLVVYVHGSGARSHFVEAGGQPRGQNGHSTIADAVRGRARLIIVEKPGVKYGEAPENVAQASPEFRSEHTLDRWAEAVHAAVEASRHIAGIASERVLVIGHSEGGVVAAKVAADHDAVTHVAVLAGEGPSQLYSLITFARAGIFFGSVSAVPEKRVDYVLEQWKEIRADPDNPERMFFGHPYRRWSSFLGTSTLEQLLRTEAAVFAAQGTADRAVPPETLDFLVAELRARGRDVDVRRVEGADHNFVIGGGDQAVDMWADIIGQAVSWFLASPLRSSLTAPAPGAGRPTSG